MAEDYEFNWHADHAIKDLKIIINLEEQFVKKEHQLRDSLQSMHYLLEHLDERIPSSFRAFHALNRRVAEIISELTDMVDSDRMKNLKIVREQADLLKKLKSDVSHRKWKAVIDDVGLEVTEDDVLSRLRISELREIHAKFLELMKIIKWSKLIRITNNSLATDMQKEKYSDLIKYYLIQVYKIIRAYERIFRHLWRKERILFADLKNSSKSLI